MVQFSDVAFSLENFVVKKSPFQGTYDGILELNKLIQGMISFLFQISRLKILRKKELSRNH